MSTWCICPTCEGEGKHSLALGVITSSDRDQWDDEDLDQYMDGAYDQKCQTCKGSGKVTAAQLEGYEPVRYYETQEEYYWRREGGY
jgi:hypothetical protein